MGMFILSFYYRGWQLLLLLLLSFWRVTVAERGATRADREGWRGVCVWLWGASKWSEGSDKNTKVCISGSAAPSSEKPGFCPNSEPLLSAGDAGSEQNTTKRSGGFHRDRVGIMSGFSLPVVSSEKDSVTCVCFISILNSAAHFGGFELRRGLRFRWKHSLNTNNNKEGGHVGVWESGFNPTLKRPSGRNRC